MGNKLDKLYFISAFFGVIIILFIMYPILNSVFSTDSQILLETLKDKEVLATIGNSILTATVTTMIAFIFGVPFAYFMARKDFKGKRLIDSIIDIPIVIPHTVAGIILLTIFSRQCWVGRTLEELGLQVVGTRLGIIVAMLFVSMPFLINSAKNAFLSISPKMENVSRSLGATHFQTFRYITFSIGWRGILTGMILTWARAISEFGAVIIITYHPMVAPTLIFDRFNSFGLQYSKPVSTILIIISLLLFILLRIVSKRGVAIDRSI